MCWSHNWPQSLVTSSSLTLDRVRVVHKLIPMRHCRNGCKYVGNKGGKKAGEKREKKQEKKQEKNTAEMRARSDPRSPEWRAADGQRPPKAPKSPHLRIQSPPFRDQPRFLNFGAFHTTVADLECGGNGRQNGPGSGRRPAGWNEHPQRSPAVPLLPPISVCLPACCRPNMQPYSHSRTTNMLKSKRQAKHS